MQRILNFNINTLGGISVSIYKTYNNIHKTISYEK